MQILSYNHFFMGGAQNEKNDFIINFLNANMDIGWL